MFHEHKKSCLLLFLMSFCTTIYGQENTFLKKSDTLNKKRKNSVMLTEGILVGGGLLALNELWYADFARSSFQFSNDNNEWKQMDKVGHMLTSYHLGKLGMQALDWSGVSKKKQLIYGASVGFVFLTAVEVLDGFSKEWGASTGDILANAAGTGFLVGQELLWNEQRITLKYSFHQTEYAKIRPNTLGANFLEESLKDYNGQTYWLSANLWSFNKKSSIPKWLNLALGYGAEGMLYGETKTSNEFMQAPYRQFYLSLDVDLTKIKTQSKVLKTIFSVVNFIKIPSPTLAFDSNGKVKFHYLYF